MKKNYAKQFISFILSIILINEEISYRVSVSN